LTEEKKKSLVTVALLGASFDTGNLGVSALAESSIKCILTTWPDARVVLLGSGREAKSYDMELFGRKIEVKELPIRFSKNLFLPNHICILLLQALVFKLLPFKKVENALRCGNSYFEEILDIDVIADITGGDSFCDIYGLRRFLYGFLRKWFVILLGKKFIMLPQTYGPFKHKLSKVMARYLLRHADIIYSRDKEGIDQVRSLFNGDVHEDKLKLAGDVAFVLDEREPKSLDVGGVFDSGKEGQIVVGFNVSGLLYNGGYTQNNMFGLKVDYRELVEMVIGGLLEKEKVSVLLVPHVFPPSGYEVESDPDACREVYEKLSSTYPGRIFLAKGNYDQGEIKYIIGLCDFFVGSRMHSCIAAMSQGVPAVGIAYSKKFRGVFESVGVEWCVAEACNQDCDQILEMVEKCFAQRSTINQRLVEMLPGVKEEIMSVFANSYP